MTKGVRGEGKQVDLFEDIGICTHIHCGETHSDNMTVPKIKLDQIFKEKYQGQFEIDLENKILYRTVKSYRNFPTSIIDIKYRNEAGKKYKKHPTTKPVEVLEYLLDHYTEENDLVLDMTSGSGSTAVACKNMNRNFVGSEISKVWYDVALQRLDIK
jgi:DNA modification methylase